MHRITVVTNSISSDVPSDAIPSSPVPALDAASDYSTGDEPSPDSLKLSVSRPAKISNWRKRGLRHVPSSDPEPIQLDMSFLQRHTLPIQLVVDQPVPVENCYDDPDTQAFVDYFSHSRRSKKGSRRGKSKSRRNRSIKPSTPAVQEVEEKSVSTGTSSGCNKNGRSNNSSHGEAGLDLNFANFDLFNSQDEAIIAETPLESSSANLKAALPPQVSSGQQDRTETLSKCTDGTDLSSKIKDEDVQLESTESLSATAEEATSQSIITNDSISQEVRRKEILKEAEPLVRCTSVIRMEFEGEMVSVSEERAGKIQECDWV